MLGIGGEKFARGDTFPSIKYKIYNWLLANVSWRRSRNIRIFDSDRDCSSERFEKFVAIVRKIMQFFSLRSRSMKLSSKEVWNTKEEVGSSSRKICDKLENLDYDKI